MVYIPAPIARPTLAVDQIPAAVVRPLIETSLTKITPAPRKPTPVITFEAILEASARSPSNCKISKNPYFEIVETYYNDKLEYPDFKKPTLDDVRFIQWNGGKHWYAKVNKEDVTDEFGRQKWNTKDEAEKAAKWYIAKYY